MVDSLTPISKEYHIPKTFPNGMELKPIHML